MKKFLLLVALATLTVLHITDQHWSEDAWYGFVVHCTLNNMASGNAVKPSKYYCACVATAYERQRSEAWSTAPDNDPADDQIKADTSKLCTEHTYAKFPEAR